MWISAYRWTGDIESTVSGTPIATKQFTALIDNAVNRLEFDPVPAGEYFFCMEKSEGNIGCWTASDNGVSLGFAYDETHEINADLEMYLTVTEYTENVFSKVDSIYKDYGTPPVYEETADDYTDLSGYSLPSDSLYTVNDVMPDTWVFTDSLKREALTADDVGTPRDDRTLAMFYWTWHKGQSAGKVPFNNQQFLDRMEEEGKDLSEIINNYGFAIA